MPGGKCKLRFSFSLPLLVYFWFYLHSTSKVHLTHPLKEPRGRTHFHRCRDWRIGQQHHKKQAVGSTLEIQPSRVHMLVYCLLPPGRLCTWPDRSSLILRIWHPQSPEVSLTAWCDVTGKHWCDITGKPQHLCSNCRALLCLRVLCDFHIESHIWIQCISISPL